MKLIRFGDPGMEKPGLVSEDGSRMDLSGHTGDYNEEFFAGGGLKRLEKIAREYSSALPRVDQGIRLGPPVCRPGKIVCIGLNYRDHARESGMNIPNEPVIFFKAITALCGPNDDLIIPKNGSKTDWEVELGVIIGKKASYISGAEALDYIAGYVLHNDYSERAFQLERGGQWVKGKSCDTFAPLGPFLVTKEEIRDPHNLSLWLKVNGEILQNGNTGDMIFNIPYLVSYVSQFMTLLPGDVISTGTPAGVGMGMDPPRYLKPGDRVELGIEGLGSSIQHVKAYPGD
jgi:2-keto-4-pentenoate hydratase/2-oxohepta-3-ene-1,7-dioic acid hydratase in catechol pathway